MGGGGEGKEQEAPGRTCRNLLPAAEIWRILATPSRILMASMRSTNCPASSATSVLRAAT